MNDEENEVRNLGDRIGYGRTMQLCEKLWGDKLHDSGLPRGGAHSTGPCVSMMVICLHEVKDDNGHCEICCGAGRVTKWVAKNMNTRAAPEVDVEALKKVKDAYSLSQRDEGWNDCIDHLIEAGVLKGKG